MQIFAAVLSALLVIFGLPTFAAETPTSTFSLWGGPPQAPLGYNNLIKNLTGQEFVGFTVGCLDGGSGPDAFVIRVRVFNSATGDTKYEIAPSINSTNIDPAPNCSFQSLGMGVAVSGTKRNSVRVIVLGMVEAENAIIYGYNAETGAKLYSPQFPVSTGDGYTLATQANGYGEWSSVGNFLNASSDQLRVAYFKTNTDGSNDIRITYYDVVNGTQIGEPISMTVPAPVLPTP